RSLGEKGKATRAEWEARLAASANKSAFENQLSSVADKAGPALVDYIVGLAKDPPKVASRKASEMALGPLTEKLPQLLGGSADLTGSNNTKTSATKPFSAKDYSGRYVYYGIREFGMAAAMNGMALHGGVVPYGGTFLIFSDYARNAIRLSALQQVGVVYVLTHDSIGLGEDGPTHQPVEQVMSLRLIPNLNVFRPADAIETAECWALALQTPNTPSVLALSRQNLPPVRGEGDEAWTPEANRSAKGAYRLRAANAARKVVLVATGSEVAVALETADALEAQGIGADVVSAPCLELFDQQDAAYQADVLPADALIVSIEAGVTLGWQAYTGRNGLNIGLDRFGASAPAEVLFKHFGFSAEAIVPKIIDKLAN
ncbi:MAG: transketolase, partial [Proteobacteria bacterium]